MARASASWRADKGTSAERGYGGRWQRARVLYLSAHPLCVYCKREGRVRAATVVDHVIDHKGDSDLFWDADNWQSLCKPCHDSTKQLEANGKGAKGCDANGIPLDPNHAWRR